LLAVSSLCRNWLVDWAFTHAAKTQSRKKKIAGTFILFCSRSVRNRAVLNTARSKAHTRTAGAAVQVAEKEGERGESYLRRLFCRHFFFFFFGYLFFQCFFFLFFFQIMFGQPNWPE